MTDVAEPLVLVIGEEGYWSADAVTEELDARGVRHYRLDTADFPQRMQLAARFNGRWQGRIDVADAVLRLEDVTAVYYRRPRDFELAAGLSAPERRFAHAQARVGVGGVLASLPARWMNHPAVLADCEYKPRQLFLAAQAGLAVPATLVTNQADQLRCFAAEVGELVLKPLAEPIVHEGGGYTAVYTRRLHRPELGDMDGVQLTAHCAQAWVPKTHDVRITVVGGRLFPVAIRAGSEAARVDWRSDYPPSVTRSSNVQRTSPTASSASWPPSAWPTVRSTSPSMRPRRTTSWNATPRVSGGGWPRNAACRSPPPSSTS